MKKHNLFSLPVCLLLLASCNSRQEHTANQANTKDSFARNAPVQRYGMVTGLKADKVDHYRRLHAAVWPAVLQTIKACHILHYSIYLKQLEGRYFLFSYFEYNGTDFSADMKKMAADSTTRQWWKQTAPLQQPLPEAAAQNQTWAGMEEVFHLD